MTTKKNFIDMLPTCLYNYILYLSSGPLSLEHYNKQSIVNQELLSIIPAYKNDTWSEFSLNMIFDYKKTPELDLNYDHYYFVQRYPALIPA